MLDSTVVRGGLNPVRSIYLRFLHSSQLNSPHLTSPSLSFLCCNTFYFVLQLSQEVESQRDKTLSLFIYKKGKTRKYSCLYYSCPPPPFTLSLSLSLTLSLSHTNSRTRTYRWRGFMVRRIIVLFRIETLLLTQKVLSEVNIRNIMKYDVWYYLLHDSV